MKNLPSEKLEHSRDFYSKLRSSIYFQAYLAKIKFLNIYNNSTNPESFINNIEEIGHELILNAIDNNALLFIDYGVYDFSHQSLQIDFENSNFKTFIFENIFIPLAQQLEKCANEIDLIQSERGDPLRIESYSNSLTDIAKTGLFNFISEIGSEAFHEMKQDKVKEKYTLLLNRIYNSRDLMENISNIIKYELENYFDKIYFFAINSKIVSEVDTISEENISKVNRIYNNIKSNRFPSEKIKDALMECLKLNPYDIYLYKEYLIRFDLSEIIDIFNRNHIHKHLLAYAIDDYKIIKEKLFDNPIFEFSPEEKEEIKSYLNIRNEDLEEEIEYIEDMTKDYAISISNETESSEDEDFFISLVGSFVYKDYQGFYTIANPQIKKFNNFLSKIEKQIYFEEVYNNENILFYLDETLFGSGDKGFAIMDDGWILCNVDNKYRIHINDIISVKSSGVINKTLKISTINNEFSSVFTQVSHKGVNTIAEFIQSYLDHF